jgi:IS605 OrfB family transposase
MGYVTYTFKVKRPNPGKVRRLVAFMAGPWRRGLNFCVEQAKQHRPRHAFDLHAFVSHPLRRGCGLPSQVAEACRDTAYEAYASHQSRRKNGGRGRFPHWTGVPALRLNIPRSLRLFTRGDQYWVEVSLGGPPVRLRITGKARALRKAWTGRTTHGELVWRHGELFLHVAIRVPARVPPARVCQTAIGVDLNVTGYLVVAVARDLVGRVLGTFWVPAGRLNETRRRGRLARAARQRAGRRDTVRAMKDREARRVRAYLHEATTALIRWTAQFPEPFVAMETLTGIRAKVRAGKAWNRRLHSWPFGSGQDMVRSKGARQGMRVKPLSGAFSSRDCSRCGSRQTRRSGAAFACQRCGYGLNAHLNGARNMSWRAARYIRAAAGRAGETTAERHSGPEGKRDEERPLSSHNVSLRWPFRVPPKPRTLVRGS